MTFHWVGNNTPNWLLSFPCWNHQPAGIMAHGRRNTISAAPRTMRTWKSRSSKPWSAASVRGIGGIGKRGRISCSHGHRSRNGHWNSQDGGFTIECRLNSMNLETLNHHLWRFRQHFQWIFLVRFSTMRLLLHKDESWPQMYRSILYVYVYVCVYIYTYIYTYGI